MERGSSSVLGVVLPERGHGEVSAGEEIPVCSGGGMSPRSPRCGPGQAVCQPCMWRDAGIRHDGTGDTALPARVPHPGVSEGAAHIDPDSISQTPAGLRPQSYSFFPTMGKEGKMLSPAQLVEAARWQDRILSPLHHPLGTGRALGSTATIPRKLERNVRNEAYTFLLQLHPHKLPISIFHSKVFFFSAG